MIDAHHLRGGFDGLSEMERGEVFGGTARRVHGIGR